MSSVKVKGFLTQCQLRRPHFELVRGIDGVERITTVSCGNSAVLPRPDSWRCPRCLQRFGPVGDYSKVIIGK